MALTDSLVAYWKLDESSGTREDSVGSNDLTDYNTVGTATGRIGTAISFASDNTNKYLGCSDNDDLSMGDVDFTIAGWFKRNATNATGMLANKWDWNIPSREYLLEYNTTDHCRFYIATTGQTQVGVVDTFDPSIGDWTFICGWHDSVANTINIQVNDRTVVSTAHSGGVNNGTAAFTIGPYSVLVNYALLIDIDEVGIWKRVLTSDERAALYNSGAGLTYPFTPAITASDTATVGEAASLKPQTQIAKSDAATVGESATLTRSVAAVVGADTATVAEAASLKPQTQIAKSDAATVGESATLTRSVAAVVGADTATVAEAASLKPQTQIAKSDAATVGESVALTVGDPTRLVTAADAVTVGEAITVMIASTFMARPAASSDDAYFYSAGSGTFDATGIAVILSRSGSFITSYFVRWSVTLPTGALILAAHVTMMDYIDNTAPGSPVTTTIAGHDASNPAALTSNAGANAAPRTDATAAWVWPGDTAQVEGTSRTTPALTEIIQELAGSYDYSGGAALTLFFDFTSGPDGTFLPFDSFDRGLVTGAQLRIDYIAPPNILTADSVTVGEALAVTVEAPVVSDSVTVGEALIVAVAAPQIAVSDASTVTESAILNPQLQIATADSATVADSAAAIVTDPQITAADSATVAEAISLHELSYISVADSATVADSTTQTVSDPQIATAADSAAVAESVALAVADPRITAADSATVADSATAIVTDPQITAADSATVSEAISLHELSYISVADASTVAESVTPHELSYISVADSATVAESAILNLQSGIATSDASTVTDSAAATISTPQIAAADAATVDESAQIIRELVDVRQLSTSSAVAVAESLALAVADPQIVTSDASTVAESTIVAFDHQVTAADASTVADSHAVTVSTALVATSDASTVADSAIVAFDHHVAASDAVGVSESITVTVSILQITVTDSTTVTDVCAVSVSVALVVTSDATGLTESLTLHAVLFVAVTDAASVAESYTLPPPLLSLTASDAVSASESTTAYPAQLLLQSADAITVGDTIAMFVIVLHGLVDVTLADSAAYRAILADSALYRAVVSDRTRTEGIG